MSAETETSEIIRRRLFEWGGLPKEAKTTAAEYTEWLQANKQQLPSWFPVEHSREALEAAYPFHPTLLSVFERKWHQGQISRRLRLSFVQFFSDPPSVCLSGCGRFGRAEFRLKALNCGPVRPTVDTRAQNKVRDLILDAYAEYEEESAVAQQ